MTIGQSLGNEPMSTKGHDSIGVSGYNMKQINVYINYDVHLLVRRWEETSPSRRVVEGKWTAVLQTNSTNRINDKLGNSHLLKLPKLLKFMSMRKQHFQQMIVICDQVSVIR